MLPYCGFKTGGAGTGYSYGAGINEIGLITKELGES
jgi:hypothetical protein